MKNLILIFIGCFALHGYGQLSEEQTSALNAIFEEWGTGDVPGGAVGIMKNGEFVFSHADGYASLEYGIKNNLDTKFNIASNSKQFAAMAILILERDGFLSVDDDIRTYLPNIPDFGETITIRHLLHHTSGLRSLHAILGMAGWRANDPRTTDDLFRFMERQEDLNFMPGDRFMYCNTGYNFMAKIVENITGENFIDWTKENLFEPLGMKNTYFEEDYAQIVPGNATSYYTSDNGFKKAVEYWGYVGAGNGHSTVADLMIWHKNFYEPTEGWEELFERLQTKDTLNNGDDNSYAFGVIVDNNLSKLRVHHSGAIGGYRSLAVTFPEDKLSIVVLSNYSSANVGMFMGRILQVIMPEIFETTGGEQAVPKLKKVKAKKLKQFEGNYWNIEESFAREVVLENDTLRYKRPGMHTSNLLPMGDGLFLMEGDANHLKIKFEEVNGYITMRVGYKQWNEGYFETYEPLLQTPANLKKYTGDYYSDELQTTYTITFKKGKLVAKHPRHGDIELHLPKEGVAQGEWPLNVLLFEMNESNEVIGCKASNNRVLNVKFVKQ